jgi:hypothetical protein
MTKLIVSFRNFENAPKRKRNKIPYSAKQNVMVGQIFLKSATLIPLKTPEQEAGSLRMLKSAHST